MKYSPLSRHAQSSSWSTSHWRPWPLRTSFLAVFCLVCIILGLMLEFALHKCTVAGCPTLGDGTRTQTSTGTYIMYNSVPTILTLGLGLLWAVVQHDVLRLEPYFQMSTPGGALPADSIFLEYPYIFLLEVPVQAFKRRHYVVLLSTCILFLTNIIITPLASGLFDDSELVQYSSIKAFRGALHSTEYLANNLSPSFSYMAYDFAWLNGSLPPFMTPQYAVLPIKSPADMDVENETWTAETMLFEADLSCKSAYAEMVWDPEFNDHGILFSAPELGYSHIHHRYGKFLTAWTGVADSLNQADNITCMGTYIHLWASGQSLTNSSMPQNMTVRQCQASYHAQPVKATFMMPYGVVTSVERIGTRTQFPTPSRFVSTIEGYNKALTIPSGYEDANGNIIGLGYPPPLLANVDSQLRRRLGRCPLEQEVERSLEISRGEFPSYSAVYLDNILGLQAFALYDQSNDTLSQLLDPETLDQVYRGALKLLFAVALSVEMVNPDAEEPVSVSRGIPVRGFRIDDLSARLVQGGMGVVIILVVALGLLNRQRRCNLDGEPNSLAAALRVLSASPQLSEDLAGAEFQRPTDLRIHLQDGRRYELELVEGWGPKILVHSPKRDGLDPVQLENKKPWMERVWPLETASGVALLLINLVLFVLLIVAYKYSCGKTGLSTFAPVNSFGYKLLFSYIPIGFTTAFELVLVTLGSYFCMLGPYKPLHQGNAHSRNTLAIDYDKSPPHFLLYQALRRGHITLAALTTAILLTNVLAVGFAGLFSNAVVEIVVPTEGQTPVTVKIRGGFIEPALEMYYIATGNISRDIPAPPWTTTQYYILPFFPVVHDSLRYFEGQTLGVGAAVECSLVPVDSISVTCRTSTNETTTTCPNGAHPEKDMLDISVDDSCWKSVEQDDMDYIRKEQVPRGWFSPTGEIFAHNHDCPDIFWALWVERPPKSNPDPNDNTTLYEDNFRVAGLQCTAKEKVIELRATVNDLRQVLSVVEIRQLNDTEVEAMYSTGISGADRLLPTFIETIATGIYKAASHTHRLMWMDHLMVTLQPSIAQTGMGLTHIPNTTDLPRTFEDVFIRLFAINLQLYADDIFTIAENRTTPTTAVVQRDRVKMKPSMMFIVVGILLYVMAVLVVLYWVERQRIPGHIPTNIAGMYALLYASNAKNECGLVKGKDPVERAKSLYRLRKRYSYGPFTTEAGTKHVGVYREESDEVNTMRKGVTRRKWSQVR